MTDKLKKQKSVADLGENTSTETDRYIDFITYQKLVVNENLY